MERIAAAVLLCAGILVSALPRNCHGGKAATKLFMVHGAVNVKLMAQHGLNPKAAQVRPEDVVDTTVCKKLDDSGFIDALLRNQ